MILLYRQQVIAALLIQGLAHRLDLRMGRIGQHDFADHVEFGQLLPCGWDFVAALFDQRGAQPATGAADGTDGLHIGMTDFFAIEDDQPVLDRAQDLFLPQEQYLLQPLGVDFREHGGKTASLGAAHPFGVRIEPKLQRAQLALRQRGGVVG